MFDADGIRMDGRHGARLRRGLATSAEEYVAKSSRVFDRNHPCPHTVSGKRAKPGGPVAAALPKTRQNSPKLPRNGFSTQNTTTITNFQPSEAAANKNCSPVPLGWSKLHGASLDSMAQKICLSARPVHTWGPIRSLLHVQPNSIGLFLSGPVGRRTPPLEGCHESPQELKDLQTQQGYLWAYSQICLTDGVLVHVVVKLPGPRDSRERFGRYWLRAWEQTTVFAVVLEDRGPCTNPWTPEEHDLSLKMV